MKKVKGFTLIELIITLTIASILSGYAMPSFYHLKLNKQMESERNRLTGSFHLARNYAISYQTYVIVCPSLSGTACDNQSNWHDGWMVFIDNNKNRDLDDNDKLLRFEGAMTSKLESLSSVYRSKIRYNNMGFSPGTNVSINFCDKRGADYAKSIIISNSGRIKQSKPITNNVCS